jgi:hypothetical protein
MERSGMNETIGMDRSGVFPDCTISALSPLGIPQGPFLLRERSTCKGGFMMETDGMNIISIKRVDVERVEDEAAPWAPGAIEALLSKWLVRAYARRYNDDMEEGTARPEEVPALAHSRI